MRKHRWIVAVTAGSLLLAACGDVNAPPDTTGPTTEVAQCGSEPIKLAVNAWAGAAANAGVAGAVMQQEMGCQVELVDIGEFPQFPAMAQGDIDATLEVWPSVHPQEKIDYIDNPESGVVDGGELGVLGNIGWFIPSYVLDEHPEFATYEGLKGNESFFATPETEPKGQFLGSDPAFGFYDEQIAKSLGLDFKFVYAGSETGSLAALDKAFAKKAPLLMYFWSPHWAQEKYDLVEVQLPPFDDACAKALEDNPDTAEGYACDYADDHLYKAFSTDLETKDPAAFQFLSNFNWTAEDQNPLGLAIQEGGDPLEVGQEWVDANPDRWQAWLPTA